MKLRTRRDRERLDYLKAAAVDRLLTALENREEDGHQVITLFKAIQDAEAALMDAFLWSTDQRQASRLAQSVIDAIGAELACLPDDCERKPKPSRAERWRELVDAAEPSRKVPAEVLARAHQVAEDLAAADRSPD